VDEAAFLAARGAIGGRPCVFERALLVRRAGCSCARRHALAEREAIGCRLSAAHANCATLLGMLRERCAFALKIGRLDEPLQHAMTMRLQCGGLAGLAQAVEAEDVHDVHALVTAAQDAYGGLSDAPWPGIVAAVAAWQGRRRQAGHAS